MANFGWGDNPWGYDGWGGVGVEQALTGTSAAGTVGNIVVSLSGVGGNGVAGSVSYAIPVSLTGIGLMGSVGSLGFIYWSLIDDYQDALWVDIDNSQNADWSDIHNSQNADWQLVETE